MAVSLEERMSALEAEVERLKRKSESPRHAADPWWKPFVGAFENDPLFEEAVRHGREYRESQRFSEEAADEDSV
jgi:hypothetical protein